MDRARRTFSSMKNKIKLLQSPARGVEATLPVLAGLLGTLQPTSAADGRFVNLSTRALVGMGD